MTVLSKIRGLHHFHRCSSKYGASSHLGRHPEKESETVGRLYGFLLALRIDAHMRQLKSKHGLNRLPCELFDLVPFPRIDQIPGNHPGTAAGNDLVKIQIGGQILCVYPAGWHKFHVHIGRRHGLDLGQSA